MQPVLSTEAAVPFFLLSTRGISSWPDVEDRRVLRKGRTETVFMLRSLLDVQSLHVLLLPYRSRRKLLTVQ